MPGLVALFHAMNSFIQDILSYHSPVTLFHTVDLLIQGSLPYYITALPQFFYLISYTALPKSPLPYFIQGSAYPRQPTLLHYCLTTVLLPYFIHCLTTVSITLFHTVNLLIQGGCLSYLTALYALS
jgi:hypothetical protein